MLTRWGKRRYSDVRGCCGWSRASRGCEPARVARRAGRGRRGKTLAPQGAAKQCWSGLPEANRQAAVRWLAGRASRVVAARLPGVGAAGVDVGDLAGEGGGHDIGDRAVAVAAAGQQGERPAAWGGGGGGWGPGPPPQG